MFDTAFHAYLGLFLRRQLRLHLLECIEMKAEEWFIIISWKAPISVPDPAATAGP